MDSSLDFEELEKLLLLMRGYGASKIIVNNITVEMSPIKESASTIVTPVKEKEPLPPIDEFDNEDFFAAVPSHIRLIPKNIERS